MSKIIFMDIDGTIVDYDGHSIPESTRKAIQQARSVSHRVYLNTGRSKAELTTELTSIGFDGLIGADGGYIEDHNHVIMHQSLSLDDEKVIVDWLLKRGLSFYLESNEGLFASPEFKEATLATFRQYTGNVELDLDETFPMMIYNQNLYRASVNKISFALHSYQDYLDAKQLFNNFEVGTWGGKGDQALFGDIRPKNISKSRAVDRLLEYLGASREQTIAVGDAKIDIPMFEYCQVGVAMGNAGSEAKMAADMVTTDLNDDGVWNAFEKLGLFER